MTLYILVMYLAMTNTGVANVGQIEFQTEKECKAAKTAYEASDGSASYARGVCITQTFTR
jgi:hypothetical protein